MTRNELEILKQIGKQWFLRIMNGVQPDEPMFKQRVRENYYAIGILKDYDDALKELEKGIIEES